MAHRLASLTPRSLRRALIVAAVVGVVLLAGYWFWLRDSSLFAVKRVDVVGAAGINAKRIRAALGDAGVRMTTLNIDEGALRRSVHAFPEVSGIDAHGKGAHGLRILLHLRLPVATLAAGDQRLPVAGDGTILRGEQPSDRLPRVAVDAPPHGNTLHSGPALMQVNLLAAAPAQLRRRVSRIVKGRDGSLRLTLHNGPALIFGDTSRLAAKWVAATRVLADSGAVGARYVDVRIPERAVAGGLGSSVDAPQGTDLLHQGACSTPTAPTSSCTSPSTGPSTGASTPSSPSGSTASPRSSGPSAGPASPPRR